MELENLRVSQEELSLRLNSFVIEESPMEREVLLGEGETPRSIIPEDIVQEAEEPTFQILGTASTPTGALTSPEVAATPFREIKQGFVQEFPATPAPSPMMPSPLATPLQMSPLSSSSSAPMETRKLGPIFRSGFGETPGEETPSIPIEFTQEATAMPMTPPTQISEELPSSPATTILPIVQPSPPMAPSEELAIPISVPKVPIVPTGKTYLIPWHIQSPTEELQVLLKWLLETLVNVGEDRVRLLISGEVAGKETLNGFTAYFLTNNDFASKDQLEHWQKTFPHLMDTIQSSGLLQIPFQIEIRQGESLGWSLRSELSWPHVVESMVVVVPSHWQKFKENREYDPAAEPLTFEEEVLQLAQCPVIQFKL